MEKIQELSLLCRNSGKLFNKIRQKVFCFPGGSESEEPGCHAGDLGLISESGRFPGEGNSNLFSILLENPIDRGAWHVTVHGVEKSWTQLSN